MIFREGKNQSFILGSEMGEEALERHVRIVFNREGKRSVLPDILLHSTAELEPVEATTFGQVSAWSAPDTSTVATTLAEVTVYREVLSIKQLIQELMEKVDTRTQTYSIQLKSMTAGVKVKEPISILIEESDDEAIASWLEVGSFGHGGTVTEAIRNLKVAIEEEFLHLISLPDNKLGSIAKQNRETMASYLERVHE